ncbi:MAG: hypothetical protein KAJ46_03265 [Sedimentisphaerales bacterium]|nr:hypothetical protein [Sedimentisphaerales bacterium]
MAVRKGRPALIELIDKGSTSTPGWFYGKKKSRLQQLRKGTTVTEPIAPAVPVGGIKIPSPTAEQTIGSAPEPVIRSAPKTWLEFADDKLVLSLSYWKVLPLVALGLILILAIAYRLGQSSVPGTNTTDDTIATANINAKGPLKNIQSNTAIGDSGSQETSEDLIDNRTTVAESRSVDKTTEKVEIKKAAAGTATSAILPPQTGLCLILCGHRDKNILEPVRQYFNANGFATVIGLYGRGYVLVHARSVQKTTSPEAAAIQQRVIELGNRYENDKPRNAPGFAAAWKSPYFVRTSDVQF